MERFVMLAAGDLRHNKRFGNRMRPTGEDPAHEDDQHVLKARARERRSEKFQRAEEGLKKWPGHGLPPFTAGGRGGQPSGVQFGLAVP